MKRGLLILLTLSWMIGSPDVYGDEDEPLIQKVAEGRSKVEVEPPEKEASAVQRFADKSLDQSDRAVYKVIETPWHWLGAGIDATVKAFQTLGRSTYRFLTQPFRRNPPKVASEPRLTLWTAT